MLAVLAALVAVGMVVHQLLVPMAQTVQAEAAVDLVAQPQEAQVVLV
jgi:hypothetical protein